MSLFEYMNQDQAPKMGLSQLIDGYIEDGLAQRFSSENSPPIMMAQMRQEMPNSTGEVIGTTSEGRPQVANDDASMSTERTITIDIGGKWYNIPTMYGGKIVPDDRAREIAISNGLVDPETGRAFNAFPTVDDAVSAAQQRSNGLGNEQGSSIIDEINDVYVDGGFSGLASEYGPKLLDAVGDWLDWASDPENADAARKQVFEATIGVDPTDPNATDVGLGAVLAGTIAGKGLGFGMTFLDDVARGGVKSAVRQRKDAFRAAQAAKDAEYLKAADPSSRISGVKTSYSGEFGNEKVIPLDKINEYNAGLKVDPHPMADPTPRASLSIDDLEGRIVAATPGDQSDVSDIRMVLGKDVGHIENKGGSENASLGDVVDGEQVRAGWKSANSKMRRVGDVVSANPSEEVLSAFVPMKGAASDFQPVTARVLEAISDPTAITKKDAIAIDKLINIGPEGSLNYKDYPGVKSDEFMPWLLGKNHTKRSNIIKSMTKVPKHLKDDFPKGKSPFEVIPGFDIHAARHAVTDPTMIDKPLDFYDPSISKFNYFDANAPVIPTKDFPVPHESFDSGIKGGRFGEFKEDREFPMSLLFQDYFTAMAKEGRSNTAAHTISRNMAPTSKLTPATPGIGEPAERLTPSKIGLMNDYIKYWDEY